jgi:hypothetical protein
MEESYKQIADLNFPLRDCIAIGARRKEKGAEGFRKFNP